MAIVSFVIVLAPLLDLTLAMCLRCIGPEILAEVKVEIFRAKEGVTAEDLRDRNNVQEHLLDKFEDGPYAIYEFSFKDGREPSQITSPISSHASATTSDAGKLVFACVHLHVHGS